MTSTQVVKISVNVILLRTRLTRMIIIYVLTVYDMTPGSNHFTVIPLLLLSHMQASGKIPHSWPLEPLVNLPTDMKVVPQYIAHVEYFLKLHNFGDIIKLYSATSNMTLFLNLLVLLFRKRTSNSFYDSNSN